MNGAGHTEDDRVQPIPSRFELAPAQVIQPPLETAAQTLPFHDLSWENFERLCYRLAREDAEVTECRIYGNQGDDQEGIDLYALRAGRPKRRVHQCKKVKDFGPAKIIAAVDKFLDGDLVAETEEFFLCTSRSLRGAEQDDEWSRQRERLQAKGIGAKRWDADELSALLKDRPRLVFDFFGPEWFRRFFNREPDEFRKRLPPSEVARFRSDCRVFYEHVFDQWDPGLPLGRGQESHRLCLSERFVVPDIEEDRDLPLPATFQSATGGNPETNPQQFPEVTAHPDSPALTPRPGQVRAQRIRQRFPLIDWLARVPQQVIRGEPGAGKSTLLRFLALDVLSSEPVLTGVARKWGEYLPVWVPFPFWTKQIAIGRDGSTSLTDMLRAWFHQYDRDALWPLVERALEDERLLLLVDGLDEWRDEVAAHTALDQLVVFIRDRRTPAVLVSRPRGFERLRSSIPGWPVANLASLSAGQQQQLAEIWFREDTRRHSPQATFGEHQRSANTRASEFQRELSAAPDLAELAQNALLLGLLIRLALEHQQLPRNRFAAYEAMIDLLLEYHPIHRRKAARLAGNISSGQTSAAERLGPAELKEVFADLAWRLHSAAPDGTIAEDSARRWLEEYLGGDHGLGLEPADARSAASALLALGETEYGVLVRKSPTEVGFFHRTCQETLASRRVSTMKPVDQLSILRSRATDPLWREALLAVLHRAEKPFLRDALEQLRALHTESNIADRLHIEALFAEIAFSEARIFPDDQRRLINQTFETIECGEFFPHRERLLRIALGALEAESHIPRESIRARVKRWFPGQSRHRIGLLMALAKWPRDPEVEDVLLRNLHDEEAAHIYAASSSLVALAAGDAEIGERFAHLARVSSRAETRGSSLRALSRGWPEHHELLELAGLNRDCGAPEPMVAAIEILVDRGLQTESDRDALITIGRRARWYQVEEDVRRSFVACLVKGWPRDGKIKQVALEGLEGPDWQLGILDDHWSFQLLFIGYAGDDEAAEAIAKKFSQKPLHLSWYEFGGHDALLSHARCWRDHAKMSETFEHLFLTETERHDFRQIDFLGVCPTNKLRDYFIQMLRERKGMGSFLLQALIRVWGRQDATVEEAVRAYTEEHPSAYAEAGEYVELITGDRDMARRHLLAELSPVREHINHLALTALRHIDEHLASDDVVYACFQLIDAKPDWFDVFGVRELLEHGSAHPRVRQFAIKLLDQRECYPDSLAVGFCHDSAIRERLLPWAWTLHDDLREIAVERLDRMSVDDPYAMDLLSLHKLEPHDAVKTAAAVGYARRKYAGRIPGDSDMEEFTRTLVVLGADCHPDQRASIAALIAVGRYDLLPRQAVPKDKNMEWAWNISAVSRNHTLRRLFAENWDRIETVLGEDAAALLPAGGEFPFLSLLISELPASSPLIKWAWRRHAKRQDYQDEGELRLVAKMRPRSSRLQTACLEIIAAAEAEPPPRGSQWRARNVAAVLAESFSGDPETLAAIVQNRPADEWTEGRLVAISRGWPDSEELRHWGEIAEQKQLPITYPTLWHTGACLGRSQWLACEIRKLFDPEEDQLHRAFDEARPVVVERVRRDPTIATWLMEEIRRADSPSLLITSLALLHEAGVRPDGLAEWTKEHALQLTAPNASTRFGLNLMNDAVEPLTHLLLRSMVGR